MDRELLHKLNLHARKGGKTSRRRQVARVKQMLEKIGKPPQQIGRGDVYAWIQAAEAEMTRRDRYYAAALLWELVYQKTLPKPCCLQSSKT